MKAITLLALAVLPALGLYPGCNAITGVDPPQHLGSGGATSGSASGGAGGAGPTSPSLAAASHLQLWLTADKGFDCDTATGRVKAWRDQSGHGRDTSTVYGQLPPRCQTHTLNGIDVPFFDAPASKNGEFVDGTLDVDLGFLQGTEHTIFVVERRWADRTAKMDACRILGTTQADETLTCASKAAFHSALQVGYVYYDGFPAVGMDFTCLGCGARIAPVPIVPPAPAAIDMSRFAVISGSEFWVNGIEIGWTRADTGLAAASGGALGRAQYVFKSETRYIGDLAEVVIFDAALSWADQAAMEAYLEAHWAQPFAVPPP